MRFLLLCHIKLVLRHGTRTPPSAFGICRTRKRFFIIMDSAFEAGADEGVRVPFYEDRHR
jgi:hypothetical protein